MLYMVAMSATLFNPDMKEMYAWLRDRGKTPYKAALVAVMRKLIVNALLRDWRMWVDRTEAAIN